MKTQEEKSKGLPGKRKERTYEFNYDESRGKP